MSKINEKVEWKKYISTLDKMGQISSMQKRKLMAKLNKEGEELTDEYKDSVLDMVDSCKEKKNLISAREYIKKQGAGLRDRMKKIKNAPAPNVPTVKIPKVKAPKIKSPKTRTYPQDDSAAVLIDLLGKGYTHAIFRTSGSSCQICLEKEGMEYELNDLSYNSPHNAPLFGHHHVGCRDYYEVISKTNPELPPVNVGPGTRWAGISAREMIKRADLEFTESSDVFGVDGKKVIKAVLDGEDVGFVYYIPQGDTLVLDVLKIHNAENRRQGYTSQMVDEILNREPGITTIKAGEGGFTEDGCAWLQGYAESRGLKMKGKRLHISAKERIYIHFENGDELVDDKVYAIPLERFAEKKMSLSEKVFSEWIGYFTNRYGNNIFLIQGSVIKEQAGFDIIKVEKVIKKSQDINDIISEPINVSASIVDYPYESLPEDLWEKKGDTYKLKHEILQEIDHIINDVLNKKFNNQDQWLEDIFFGGSTGTQLYSGDEADIDLKIIIDWKVFLDNNEQFKSFTNDDDLQKELIGIVREEEYKIGNHPIDLYVYDERAVQGKRFLDNYDSLYSIFRNSWLKPPPKISLDTYNREDKIQKGKEMALEFATRMDGNIGELRRDIRDYELIKEHLKSMPSEAKKKFVEDINKITIDLENEIKKMVEAKDFIIDERHKAYHMEFIEDAENFYTSLNWLPQVIRMKLLSWWKYLSLARDLGKLLEDDNKITEDEIPEIKQIIKENKKISARETMIKKAAIPAASLKKLYRLEAEGKLEFAERLLDISIKDLLLTFSDRLFIYDKVMSLSGKRLNEYLKDLESTDTEGYDSVIWFDNNEGLYDLFKDISTEGNLQQKMILFDQIINYIHENGKIADYAVEGGQQTLDEINQGLVSTSKKISAREDQKVNPVPNIPAIPTKQPRPIPPKSRKPKSEFEKILETKIKGETNVIKKPISAREKTRSIPGTIKQNTNRPNRKRSISAREKD